jgi:hypothetical protein
MISRTTLECLLVSRDVGVLRIFERLLNDLSVSVRTCLSPGRAFESLDTINARLVVVDCDGEDSCDFVHKLWRLEKHRQPTVLALCSDSPAVIAHFVVAKPVTEESAAKSVQNAYTRMLREHRRHARHLLMLPVTATFDDGRSTPVIVSDIGDGGVGLRAEGVFTVGDVLTFRLPLPGAPRQIHVHVRVSWTRPPGRAGCEFVRIPPVDLTILNDWLQTRTAVKKPRKDASR